jgi:alpha-L-rhamnosidase
MHAIAAAGANQSDSRTAFLPIVGVGEGMIPAPAFWIPSGGEWGTNQIALFRCRVAGDDPVVALHLFADTRYEAWLDGRRLGRGPARFSSRRAEYDVYALEEPAEEVNLAVLVQWAPNTRRSEASMPLFRAEVVTANERRPFSTSECKVNGTDAWDRDGPHVHSWGLIGPTEVLDLRRLPSNWHEPGYDDSAWRVPRLMPGPPGVMAARSIPSLVDTAVEFEVTGAGTLADGRRLVTIAGRSHVFSVADAGEVGIEVLAGLPGWLVDGVPLALVPVGAERPEVLTATVWLEAGDHVLFPVREPTPITEERQEPVVAMLRVPNAAPGIPPLKASPGPRLLLAEGSDDFAGVVVAQGDTEVRFSPGAHYVVLDLERTVYGRFSARANGPAAALWTLAGRNASRATCRWHTPGRPIRSGIRPTAGSWMERNGPSRPSMPGPDATSLLRCGRMYQSR